VFIDKGLFFAPCSCARFRSSITLEANEYDPQLQLFRGGACIADKLDGNALAPSAMLPATLAGVHDLQIVVNGAAVA